MRRRVEPDAVADDAGGVERAGRLLAGVRVGAALGPLASFLPGGQVARCLAESRSEWDRQVASVAREVGALADGLTATAAGYTEVESVVARHLGGHG
ncbi:hypothetical protein [Intrasporangium oryzae]|nr:hypothetical protein [Intrasporangium oryzae]